ncbi:hypothetical protein BHE74_00029068 [Ensete ventricosum]|nr:hypothetical protein BHE74_00029068 [Ensete ventricosum]
MIDLLQIRKWKVWENDIRKLQPKKEKCNILIYQFLALQLCDHHLRMVLVAFCSLIPLAECE